MLLQLEMRMLRNLMMKIGMVDLLQHQYTFLYMFYPRYEDLILPTSRLEKKRRHLNNVYERAQRREERKKHDLLRRKLSVEDAGLIREKHQNEYEKNKARNYKTNIQFPTPVSTVRSSRSRSARPSRSKSSISRNRSSII